jgi:hypothetical protein
MREDDDTKAREAEMLIDDGGEIAKLGTGEVAKHAKTRVQSKGQSQTVSLQRSETRNPACVIS